jgi:hypothetical protein
MCPTAWRPFPPSDISTHTLSRCKPRVKAVSPLIPVATAAEDQLLKRPSCGDSSLAVTPQSLRSKSRSRGNIQNSGSVYGFSWEVRGRPAVGREGDYVENFP